METPITQFNVVSRISQVDICACVRACRFLEAVYAQRLNNWCLRAPPPCALRGPKKCRRIKKSPPPVASTDLNLKIQCGFKKDSVYIDDRVLAVNTQDSESEKRSS